MMKLRFFDMLTRFVTWNVTCNANVTQNVVAKSFVSQICYKYKIHSYIIILYRGINNRDIKYILIRVDTSLRFLGIIRARENVAS